jgi:hypothetical protein
MSTGERQVKLGDARLALGFCEGPSGAWAVRCALGRVNPRGVPGCGKAHGWPIPV